MVTVVAPWLLGCSVWRRSARPSAEVVRRLVTREARPAPWLFPRLMASR